MMMKPGTLVKPIDDAVPLWNDIKQLSDNSIDLVDVDDVDERLVLEGLSLVVHIVDHNAVMLWSMKLQRLMWTWSNYVSEVG